MKAKLKRLVPILAIAAGSLIFSGCYGYGYHGHHGGHGGYHGHHGHHGGHGGSHCR